MDEKTPAQCGQRTPRNNVLAFMHRQRFGTCEDRLRPYVRPTRLLDARARGRPAHFFFFLSQAARSVAGSMATSKASVVMAETVVP
jgi:hypothetical protein